MPWESGRTPRTLLQAVRESKAKKADHIRRFFERSVPQYLVLTELVQFFPPMLPQVGLEPTTLRLTEVTSSLH